jgi:Beta-lactamase superfamily domain
MALWRSFGLTSTGGRRALPRRRHRLWRGGIFPRIREAYGPPDVLLPIGAYEPRWFMQAQHVNPEEAVRIMLDCGAGRAFGRHWGTFRLTHQPAEAPAADLARALAAQGLLPERFARPQAGPVGRAAVALSVPAELPGTRSHAAEKGQAIVIM